MKKTFLNILFLSIGLTTFGLLIDSDVREPSAIMRFFEFFAMVGITFMLMFVIYFSFKFSIRKVKQIMN